MAKYINATQFKALRTAGFLYILMAFTAPVGLLYVPSKLIVSGDTAATVERIRASEWLLRIGIGSELFHQAIAVYMVLAFYRLFKSVNENQAKLLVVLGALVSVPIMFINTLNYLAALVLINGAGIVSAIEASQWDALAMLFIQLHGDGITVASIFWGLWLFPFGTLVIQSGFIPRIFGYLLYIAGVAYAVAAAVTLVVPQFANDVNQVALILEIAEVPIVFWFVYKALRPSGLVS